MRLSYNVLFASSAFSFFFYTVVIYFAWSYEILGNSTGGHPDSDPHGDGNDYERLHPFLALVLYSYRTSIGDLETPNAILWAQIRNNDQHGTLIVYVIWFVWLIEQFFMLIVFLNFLIAIISQVYEQDMVNSLSNQYTQKCEMNLEVDHIMRFFYFR